MSEKFKPCYVYLICTDLGNDDLEGPCKIGITDAPDSRLKQVQTGSPKRLVIAFDFRVWDRKFARRIEASFHAGFGDYRLNGEWFDLHPIDALRGLVDVFKMGLDRVFEGEPNAAELLQSTAEACNLMDAARLLHQYYEARGELTTQTKGPVH